MNVSPKEGKGTIVRDVAASSLRLVVAMAVLWSAIAGAHPLPRSGLQWNGTSLQLPTAEDPTKYLLITQDGSSAQITAAGGLNLLVGSTVGTDELNTLRLHGSFVQLTSDNRLSPGGFDLNFEDATAGVTIRGLRLGCIGSTDLAANPGCAMALELGELNSGPETTQVAPRGLWIGGTWLWGSEQNHIWTVEESRTGPGRGFLLVGGPGKTGGNNNGGDIVIAGGAKAGSGVAGAVDINTTATSGNTTIGAAGVNTVMLAGATTAPNLTLPASGTLTVSGSHNGVAGAWYPDGPATRLLGTPALTWRSGHFYSASNADGVVVHNDATDTEKASIVHRSSGVLTGWHFQSASGNVALYSQSGVAATAGAIAALLYPSDSAGYACLLNTAGTCMVRVNGAGDTLGLYGANPVARPAAYTLSFPSSSRTLDALGTNTSAVLQQLILDLQAVGLLQ